MISTYHKMRHLDEQERAIVAELIKNPRLSDNQVAKLSRVPVMTVNRKRKILEKEGLLNYFCYLDTSRYGLNTLPARQLYFIRLKIGLTKREFVEKVINDVKIKNSNNLPIYDSFIGEDNGNLIWVLTLEGGKGNEIMELFNGKIVPMLKEHFGDDCIEETKAIRITTQLKYLHNYLPLANIKDGRIKEDWPKEYLFID